VSKFKRKTKIRVNNTASMAWDECQHGLTHGFGHGFRHGFASERNKREELASAKSSKRERECEREFSETYRSFSALFLPL
jgi:hypothetical protein